MKKSKAVDSYIAKAPKEARPKLKEMRAIIRKIAPDAAEGMGYGMPSYDKGSVAWFASMKEYIGLYLRPPVIAEHARELAGYKTTKSSVHFPLGRKLPAGFIGKLIRARMEKVKRKGKTRANQSIIRRRLKK